MNMPPGDCAAQERGTSEPYSEKTVHLAMWVERPFASLKTLQPYTAAFGGVYTVCC
jgi:hypothetical protein